MCSRLADIPITNFLQAPKCCACEGALTGPVHTINLGGKAAVVCPKCQGKPVRFYIEVTAGGIIYRSLPLPVLVRD